MRSSRLVALLLELTRVRRTTVAELAARLGVVTRTIQRDLVALQEIGVPVWTRTGPAGGVGLVEGWRSPLTGMLAAEVQALLLGQAGSRELGLQTEFETARAKMLSSPGAPHHAGASAVERFHVDHQRWFTEPERPPALPAVADAVWTGRRLSIRYGRAGRSEAPVRRRLDPLGLVLKTDRWYLVAAHRRSVRTYRVSRITAASILEEDAWRPADFSLADYWQRSRARFEHSVNSLSVRLSLPEDSAETLRAALPGTQVDAAWEQARRVTEPSTETGGVVRLEVSLMTEALEIVGTQLLGVPGVEVHEPYELRRLLHERGRDLAARNAFPDPRTAQGRGSPRVSDRITAVTTDQRPAPSSPAPSEAALPRLVAFDIDGTLFDSSKRPQPGTLRAFAGLRAAGTRIMLASGRPIPGLRALAERSGLGTDLIFAGLNGSVVVDQATGRTLARHPVPGDLAQPLIATGVRHGALMMLPHDDELIVADDGDPQAVHEAGGNGLTLRVVEDITAPGIEPTKILYYAERPQLEILEAELRERFAGQIELTYSSPIYMEATAAGVDKSTALLDFCRAEGIDPAQTMAFGDNGNDVTMLRAAGTGVAMGNAIPEAQEAADIVTATHDDEGIARVLSRWVDVGELPAAR